MRYSQYKQFPRSNPDAKYDTLMYLRVKEREPLYSFCSENPQHNAKLNGRFA